MAVSLTGPGKPHGCSGMNAQIRGQSFVNLADVVYQPVTDPALYLDYLRRAWP